jgi:chorismate lyase / 3-hydroxybenzoate synthase
MGIKTAYMPFPQIDQQAQSWKDSALGAICFCKPLFDNNIAKRMEIPTIQLHAPILDGAAVSSEIWLSNPALPQCKPLMNGHHGAIHYRFNDELLFGVICVPETDSLQNATESAYRQIFTLMEDLNYPYIYRFWNYMADINGVNNGLERYRQFNVGRKDAFFSCDSEIGNQLPAACALGLVDGPLTIAFLLGRQPPVAIENPRQINAYEYPEEYGPRTPSFSRATLIHSDQDALLFISGTASIVGHVTQHPLDVSAQTRETLMNLDAVIAEANRIFGEHKFNLHDIYFRVYIRHVADLSLVRDEMQRYIGGTIKAVFVQADICRQDLLLEIEATAGQMLALSSTS